MIREFQKKYLGSYLGLLWAFIQPTAFIFILWLVFSIGLRGGFGPDDIPFLPWFICGIIPWFFISDSIRESTGSLLAYSFLIKQMYFRVGMIPLITIITVFIIHIFIIIIMIIFVIAYGYSPNIYWLQLPYYIIGSLLLLTGISWLTSALTVFVRDVGQTVNVVLTLFFWLTPIIWAHSNLEGNMRLIADLNPFFYITNGYRETFLTNEWFFENSLLTLYFWVFAITIFITGALVFQRLKPHFADVL